MIPAATFFTRNTGLLKPGTSTARTYILTLAHALIHNYGLILSVLYKLSSDDWEKLMSNADMKSFVTKIEEILDTGDTLANDLSQIVFNQAAYRELMTRKLLPDEFVSMLESYSIWHPWSYYSSAMLNECFAKKWESKKSFFGGPSFDKDACLVAVKNRLNTPEFADFKPQDLPKDKDDEIDSFADRAMGEFDSLVRLYEFLGHKGPRQEAFSAAIPTVLMQNSYPPAKPLALKSKRFSRDVDPNGLPPEFAVLKGIGKNLRD